MNDLHLRNLAVPFLSQRKNTYVHSTNTTMSFSTCNITCLAMLLHYLGVTEDTPDEMLQSYFNSNEYADKTISALENWANLETFAKKEYKVSTKYYDVGVCKTKDLMENIATGYPVMMSLGIETERGRENKRKLNKADPRNPLPGSGHIVVVRGFTKVGGVEHIILNDPWGSPVDMENELVPDWNYYAYYNQTKSNDGSTGDNIILKISQFEKMIRDNKTIFAAMVIYAPLFQKLNGEENMDSKVTFPITASGLWHNGMHFTHFSENKVCSIGAGKLVGVRNKTAKNGSAGFILVKHQMAKLNEEKKILTFYALYMHTKYIDIKECAKSYFLTGMLPQKYNFNWLKQLFSCMLPHVYIIGINSNQSFYRSNVAFNDGVLENLESGETTIGGQHGSRALIHILPNQINNLFSDLLNPEMYSDGGFQERMLDFQNYLIETVVTQNENTHYKYSFFHHYVNSNNIVSSDDIEPQIFNSTYRSNVKNGSSSHFEKAKTVNAKAFRRACKLLSDLHKGEIISCEDILSIPVVLDDKEHYVDTFIEIGKNEVIANAGMYNGESDMIHFEIFTDKNINIYSELNVEKKEVIVEENTDHFFRQKSVSKEIDRLLPYLNISHVRYSMFLMIRDEKLLTEYMLKRISEWDPSIRVQNFVKSNPQQAYITAQILSKKEGSEDKTEKVATWYFEEKKLEIGTYFSECIMPYNINFKDIIEKNYFIRLYAKNIYTYYHPIIFLEKIHSYQSEEEVEDS